MPLTDRILLLTTISPADRRAIAELLFRTWPKPDKDAAFRERQLEQMAADYAGDEAHAPRAYVLEDDGRIIANALIEPRTIGFDGGEMTIAGLGKVCSCPTRRGEGLGARVVRAAFAPVDRGLFPFSLFQTTPPVRAFYERIGSALVENKIIDSTSPTPDKCPFPDPVIMRYPSGDGWPEGTIDLRGPGY